MALIEDYAMIGDLQTAALVSSEGSIDWMCLPSFDSPSCFSALLGLPEHGRWLLAPRNSGRCTRRGYVAGTLVLQTLWETDAGAVRITDFMPPRGAGRNRSDDVHVVRIVDGLSGSVDMHGDLALRFDYGSTVPWLFRRRGVLHAVAGPDAACLATPAPVAGRQMHAISDFRVSVGERIPFVLTWRPSHLDVAPPLDPEEALEETTSFWTGWSSRLQFDGKHREAVERSLITLKALTFAPTGGIVAAATTSLPECPGGPRNWDYRFCWLRDATLTVQSLLAAGYTEEAQSWRGWLLRAVAGDPAKLQIMYSLTGGRRLPETNLEWLPGYEQSRPVRIGNAAASQLQLDVWGEVLDCLAVTRATLEGYGDSSWDLQVALMGFLEGAWESQDNGLWEMRGPTRHFTHSKLMCWVAADRMVKAVSHYDLPGPLDRWIELREKIRENIMAYGFDAERGIFVQAYGSSQVDASLLLIPREGFLPYTDPSVVATIGAVQRDLTRDGFLLRYKPEESDDGLPGGEGVFLACSFWLVDALVGLGRRREAEELFERLLELRNDVGLLSEEWDPHACRQLGNFPQAFSHFALVAAAFELHGNS